MSNPKTPAEILYGNLQDKMGDAPIGPFERLKAQRRGYPPEPGPDNDSPKAKEYREPYGPPQSEVSSIRLQGAPLRDDDAGLYS